MVVNEAKTPRTKRLLEIQSRITKALVSQSELFLCQFHTAAEAFGDAETFIVDLAGKLEADTVESRIVGCVNGKARCKFGNDGTKIASLDAGARGERAERRGESIKG